MNCHLFILNQHVSQTSFIKGIKTVLIVFTITGFQIVYKKCLKTFQEKDINILLLCLLKENLKIVNCFFNFYKFVQDHRAEARTTFSHHDISSAPHVQGDVLDPVHIRLALRLLLHRLLYHNHPPTLRRFLDC